MSDRANVAVVGEKRVPQYLSIGAMVGAALLTGWLWSAGREEPRDYLASMAINHHGSYGQTLDCQGCHIPAGLFTTALGCTSSKCHGELLPETLEADRMRLATVLFNKLPEAAQRGKHYLDMHDSVATQECWSCHKEHQPGKAAYPPGWTSYDNAPRQTGFRSVLNQPQG